MKHSRVVVVILDFSSLASLQQLELDRKVAQTVARAKFLLDEHMSQMRELRRGPSPENISLWKSKSIHGSDFNNLFCKDLVLRESRNVGNKLLE